MAVIYDANILVPTKPIHTSINRLKIKKYTIHTIKHGWQEAFPINSAQKNEGIIHIRSPNLLLFLSNILKVLKIAMDENLNLWIR